MDYTLLQTYHINNISNNIAFIRHPPSVISPENLPIPTLVPRSGVLTDNIKKKHIHFDLSQNETYIFQSDTPPSLPNLSYKSHPSFLRRIHEHLRSFSQYSNKIDIINIIIITSLLFFTNAVHAYYRDYWIYSGFFVFLGITFLLYRYYENVVARKERRGSWILRRNDEGVSRDKYNTTTTKDINSLYVS